MDEDRRRDKLDDSLLFLMGSVGILFGVIQFFVGGFSALLQVIAPVLLGWALPFYFGFVRGSIGDSIVERYRGWIFLVVGLTLYSLILAEEELSRFIADPQLQFIPPLAFSPFLFLFAYRLGHLRRFVLGPDFPLNEVLSRSAFNAAMVAAIIALFGALFALARFETSGSFLVAGALVVLAIIPAAFFMRRSNNYAGKVYWRYSKSEEKGRFRGHRKVELTRRVLRVMTYGSWIAVSVLFSLIRLGYDSSRLIIIAGPLLGLAVLLLPPV